MRIWQRMKTSGLAMLLAALLLVMTAVTASAASYPFTGVTTGATNMRSTANSSASNVIRRIPEGDIVEVIGATGNFYHIKYDGRSGYIFKQYVEQAKVTSSGADGVTAPGYPYTTVTTSSVNLRKSASTSAKKLDVIPKGATITVHKLSGSWANVSYSGQTGWAMKDYIKVATIVSATPAPETSVNTPDSISSYQLLQAGADGAQVAVLQEALIELGYLSGKADGKYGPGTTNAVISFQKKNDLPVTGYADVNMQALLFSGKPYNARGVRTDVKTLPLLSGITMRSGDRGELVRTMQSVLFAKGYYTGTITGIYDNVTVSAVKSFQQKNGLKADGVCGPATQELLYGDGISSNATATPKPTPTPTPLPEMVKPSSTVRQGSKGNDAKLVQQRLIDLKYLTGKADGAFGTKSVAALKAFQEKNGLKADGVCGSGTASVLFSYLCLAADEYVQNPTLPSTPDLEEDSDEELTKENVVVIKQGVTGSEVLRLQKRLEQLGYYTSAKDSKCKADDVAAIRLFQSKNGLSADGIAGFDTQVRLYSESAVMYNGQLSGSLTISYETLKKGMQGENVKAMQERLIELQYLTGTADGVFGTDTAEAVYHFQKKNGLVRDSIAGEDTLRILFSSSAVANVTENLPTVDIAADILRKGDKSDAVKTMQEKLIALGYLSGKADGVYGNLTYKAVKEFQRANALSADGIAGKNTINALNTAGVKLPTVGGSTPESTLNTMARQVKYEYWYSTVRNAARKHPYCTLYDPDSGISWQVHMFSFGKHAEIEPLTTLDTDKMNQVCGKEKWTPKVVWVIFADGTIRIATTHSVPHGVQHRTDNGFPGHACLHFPRTQAQVTAIGPYATKHQNTVDKAWAELQASLD